LKPFGNQVQFQSKVKMIKFSAFLLNVTLWIFLTGCSSKNAEKEIEQFPVFESHSFKAIPGEKLVYEVSAGPFDVGDISVFVRDTIEKVGQLSCFRIDARAGSKSGISWISQIKHDWSCWVDSASGRSVKMTRNVIENGYRSQQVSFFLPDSQIIKQYDLHKPGVPLKIFNAPPDRMKDLVNVIWQLRYTPFEESKIGDTLNYLAFFDSQWLLFKIRLAGVKTIKKKKNSFRYFVLVPLGIESKYLRGKDPVEIWIESDSRRRPFRVQVSSYFGQLAIRLKN